MPNNKKKKKTASAGNATAATATATPCDKKGKKAEKKMNRALDQYDATETLAESIRFFEESSNFSEGALPSSHRQALKQVRDRFTKRVIPVHRKKWTLLITQIKQAQSSEDWKLTEELATQVIDDIKVANSKYIKKEVDAMAALRTKKTSSRNIEQYFFCEEEFDALCYRGKARKELEQHEGAIQDWTDALKYHPATVERRLTTSNRAWLLFNRSDVFLRTRQPQMALTDLEAAYHFLCFKGETEKDFYYMRHIVRQMMRIRTHAKVKCPRPHYTDDKRDQLERKFHLGHFDPKALTCYNCGICEGDGVLLQYCSRCKEAVFCSSDCMKQAWKNDHQKECGPDLKLPLIYKDIDKQETWQNFDEHGVAQVNTERGMHTLVKDPVTGRLFDSLTDRDVYFSPSENDLIPERDLIFQIKVTTPKEQRKMCLMRNGLYPNDDSE